MSRPDAGDPTLVVLLQMLDEGFDKKGWHGPNLRGSVRRVDPALAAWRPAPGRKSIWEIAVHAAYWKYAVRRRLLGEKRGSFPLRGSNWFVRPASEADDWTADLRMLDDCHRALLAAVRTLDPAALGRQSEGSEYTGARLIAGVAAHDIYHAGQIQLLKKLA